MATSVRRVRPAGPRDHRPPSLALASPSCSSAAASTGVGHTAPPRRSRSGDPCLAAGVVGFADDLEVAGSGVVLALIGLGLAYNEASIWRWRPPGSAGRRWPSGWPCSLGTWPVTAPRPAACSSSPVASPWCSWATSSHPLQRTRRARRHDPHAGGRTPPPFPRGRAPRRGRSRCGMEASDPAAPRPPGARRQGPPTSHRPLRRRHPSYATGVEASTADPAIRPRSPAGSRVCAAG